MVHAAETTLRELLEGAKQYQVPLYQRTYSWRKENFARLWADLVRLVNDRESTGPAVTHFLGSMVLAPTPDIGPVGVSRYLVVDGQQRLTTLTVLLTALRDHRADTEGPEHWDRLSEQYLINKWKSDDQRLKLVPTQADRVTYQACVEGAPAGAGGDGIGEAYRYFRGRLADHDDPDDDTDIEKFEEAVLSGLTLVSVTTTREDNVHRIFESLNNTGLRLTQGDLLRNYLFMRLPTRGSVVYETQWLPMQRRLNNSQLELLFWLDAVQSNDSVNQGDTYQAQAMRMDRLAEEVEVEGEVKRLNRLSALLERILYPEREDETTVRERLARLNSWGTTTVYPLLLHLLDQREQGAATGEEITRAMLYAESYIVRRVITGRATAGLNRILLRAVPEIRGQGPVDVALRRYLSTGRKSFASDDQVRAGVRDVSFYYSGRAAQRKLLLSWIEQTYDNKEPVDPASCTIEHVMPQTMTDAWRGMLRADLGPEENDQEIYDSLVHTLGNLTLTGYNSSLGNKQFAAKREGYSKSGFRMNQWIAGHETWARTQIHQRAAELAERIIEHWPGPEAGVEPDPMRESWGLMNRALAELPRGTWTTYSEVARLIDSHAVPVGQRLASHAVPNGHRVLRVDGTLSGGFRWLAGSERSESQREVLEAEGVAFSTDGRAGRSQHVDADELAEFVGVELPTEELLPEDGFEDSVGRAAFLEQLTANADESTVHGVIALLEDWVERGGALEFGAVSCFLTIPGSSPAIWPTTLYPAGPKADVVFQYLKTRPPFDDAERREEFRRRLNLVPGIDLPASKLGMRPGFSLNILADPSAREGVLDALHWFIDEVRRKQTHDSTE